MVYSHATSEARHITTRLRMDAESGLERLASVSALIHGETPEVLEQMRRLWRDERDAAALQYLERYEKTLRELGALMSELGAEHIDPATISAEHRLFRIAQQSARDQRASPRHVDLAIPEDLLEDPISVD